MLRLEERELPETYLNLRSDTVTLPTREMLEAIHQAQLGDDNRGEDPTVCKLEELSAHMLGKEAAILLTSGTMGNLVGVMVHCGHGDEILLEHDAHMFHDEQGAFAAIGGLVVNRVKGIHGYPKPEDLEKEIRPLNNVHKPKTALVCLENSHNHAGGTVITPEQTDAVAEMAKRHGIPVHLDGARIFNAAVKLDVDVSRLVKNVDTVTFCLSKGLSCPAGSILLGSRNIIEKARRIRKLLGGTMRQAGIIAAPGIVALNSMVERLREDHDNASSLARELIRIPGIRIDLETVQTNMVYVDIATIGINSQEFVSRLKKHGIEFLASAPYLLRIVTHRHIRSSDIARIVDAVKEVVESAAKQGR
jgi:threonine aldolase